MKQGIILINAYTQRESELYQPKRLKEELLALGVKAEIRRNFLTARVEGGAPVVDAAGDFCVYFDKDKYAGELLERAGMRLFNPARAVAVCDDKASTFIALSGEGVPMPDTVPAPLCYSAGAAVNGEFLREVGRRLQFPLVVKECYGSLGGGVYLVKDEEELFACAARLIGKPHLFQRYVANSAGRDMRVLVIGGKAFSAMKRTSAGDFRSNVELGGRGEPAELDGGAKELCERVAKLLQLDYCGVDLLFGKEGYLVCEVNSNAFFGGMEKVTGKNVARAYAQHIVNTVYGI